MASLKQLRYLERKYGTIHASMINSGTDDDANTNPSNGWICTNGDKPAFDDPRYNPGFKFDSGFVGHEMSANHTKSGFDPVIDSPEPLTVVTEFPKVKCNSHGRRKYVLPDDCVCNVKSRVNAHGNHCTI